MAKNLVKQNLQTRVRSYFDYIWQVLTYMEI
jgi:hypothetical protein